MHGGYSGVPSGFDFFHLRKEFQGIETAGAMHFAALRQGRQNTCDQSVDMEQGHDIQASVSGTECSAFGDVLS